MDNSQNITKAMSFQFGNDIKHMLSDLSEITGRPQDFLVEKAIKQYCELQSWYVDAINEGIDSADNQQMVSHAEIKAKWEAKRANFMD